MKAVLLKAHGGAEQLEYREDVPVPSPASGEVLVRIRAAAVNNTDINTRIGWYSKSVATATATAASTDLVAARTAGAAQDGGWSGNAFVFPRIQGIDACGHIVAVGSEVPAVRIGERVILDPVLRPADGTLEGVAYLGAERDGAFAEFATVPAGNAHRIDSTHTDVELATFPCAYGTAENMLARANIVQGERVLVTGASGGVGSAAVQLAHLRGAYVIAVTTPQKARDVLALGAQQTVQRDADLVRALGRESVDAVIDVVGGATFAGLLDVLRRGGRYAIAGAITGPVVPLDLRTLYLKDLRLLGCTVTTPAAFARLVELIESGALQPIVRAVYPLAAIADAQADFLRKPQTGKIVLEP
jgi:NADPH:quinone reductase-like Zn-dependent oxidoreductase